MTDWRTEIVAWLQSIIDDASANAMHRCAAERAIQLLQIGDSHSAFTAGQTCSVLNEKHPRRAVG